MAAVYSKSFARFRDASGDSDPIPVPAGRIWIIRDISIYNGNLFPLVQAGVTSTDGIAICEFTWAAQATLQRQESRIVLDQTGDFIQCHATFGCDFWISGYELTTP